jgi:hypothetical protein
MFEISFTSVVRVYKHYFVVIKLLETIKYNKVIDISVMRAYFTLILGK